MSSCPKELVPVEFWQAAELFGFAENGTWPVAGGVLDQTPAFLDALRHYRACDAGYERKLRGQR